MKLVSYDLHARDVDGVRAAGILDEVKVLSLVIEAFMSSSTGLSGSGLGDDSRLRSGDESLSGPTVWYPAVSRATSAK